MCPLCVIPTAEPCPLNWELPVVSQRTAAILTYPLCLLHVEQSCFHVYIFSAQGKPKGPSWPMGQGQRERETEDSNSLVCCLPLTPGRETEPFRYRQKKKKKAAACPASVGWKNSWPAALKHLQLAKSAPRYLFTYLKSWSPAGSTVWKSYETFKNWVMAEVSHWGQTSSYNRHCHSSHTLVDCTLIYFYYICMVSLCMCVCVTGMHEYSLTVVTTIEYENVLSVEW